MQKEGPGTLLRAVGKGFMAQKTFEQQLEGRGLPVTWGWEVGRERACKIEGKPCDRIQDRFLRLWPSLTGEECP